MGKGDRGKPQTRSTKERLQKIEVKAKRDIFSDPKKNGTGEASRGSQSKKRSREKLKDKGFIESRKVGVNKFGLIQVAYNSYDTVEEARIALSDIRAKEDINAWLLIKN